MFNRNKTPKIVNTPQANSPAINIISEGTVFTGNIKSKDDLRIAGVIDGETLCEGKVIITATGKVIGNLSCTELDSAGTLEGEVRTASRVTLRKTAQVNGDVYTRILVVEEGGQINGACKMSPKMEAVSTQKEAKAAGEK